MQTRTSLFLIVVLGLGIMACQQTESTEPTTDAPAMEVPSQTEAPADYWAYRALEASGGAEAWAALPYLAFEFGFGTAEGRNPGRKHLWNRMNGDYRVEYIDGTDSTWVVLFNTNTREGQVAVNGVAVADTAEVASRLQRAYGAYINDTYWLLMPAKLLDEGVQRSYVPDSADATSEVIKLAFDGVGLTPGDQYWITLDKETGQVTQWAYQLQSYPPDRAATAWTWTEYQTFESPAGPVTVSTAKQGSRGTLFTDHVEVPAEVPTDAFTSLAPMLF